LLEPALVLYKSAMRVAAVLCLVCLGASALAQPVPEPRRETPATPAEALTSPKLIAEVPPPYPFGASGAARVVPQLDVDEDGSPGNLLVLGEPQPGFDEAALPPPCSSGSSPPAAASSQSPSASSTLSTSSPRLLWSHRGPTSCFTSLTLRSNARGPAGVNPDPPDLEIGDGGPVSAREVVRLTLEPLGSSGQPS